MIYCISMQWFREWEAFVKGKDNGKKPETSGACWGGEVDGNKSVYLLGPQRALHLTGMT